MSLKIIMLKKKLGLKKEHLLYDSIKFQKIQTKLKESKSVVA